jgi:hypothetical protein
VAVAGTHRTTTGLESPPVPFIQQPGARTLIAELWRRDRRAEAAGIVALYTVAYAATAILAFGSYIAALELESSSVVLAALPWRSGTLNGHAGSAGGRPRRAPQAPERRRSLVRIAALAGEAWAAPKARREGK